MLYNTPLKDVVRKIKVPKEQIPLFSNLPIGQQESCYMLRSNNWKKEKRLGTQANKRGTKDFCFGTFCRGTVLDHPHVEDDRDK